MSEPTRALARRPPADPAPVPLWPPLPPWPDAPPLPRQPRPAAPPPVPVYAGPPVIDYRPWLALLISAAIGVMLIGLLVIVITLLH